MTQPTDTGATQNSGPTSGSERILRDMLERASLIAVSLDLNGCVTFCNEFGAKLLGWRRSEMIGRDWFSNFLPPDERESVRRMFAENVRQGTIPVHHLNEVLTFDGRRRAISWSNSTLCDAEGNTIGTASIGEDITERRNAEEALRESEERYRLLFSANPLPMWVVDAQTLKFLDANNAAVRNYGFSREEFLSMHTSDIRHIDENPPLQTGEGPPGSRLVRHRKKDGAIVTVELNSFEIMYGKRLARLVTAHDVTEMKQLEEQLRQWQKMEAIGRLAAGVAHDFNNLLMAIRGYTELTLADLPQDHPHRADLEEVHKAAQRGADLTRQLLAFGRRQILKPEILDLNSVVADMNRMLLRTIGTGLELSTHLDPHLHRVRADRGQIGQVLLNLAVNARDAMPHGGKLTVETRNVVFDEEYARTHSGVKPGAYAVLSVSDSGTGIPPHVMAHLFEPFFTTKDKDKGSGFGLSTVYGIVRQSGGLVTVHTEVGVGSTFKVYLPEARGPAAKPAPARQS